MQRSFLDTRELSRQGEPLEQLNRIIDGPISPEVSSTIYKKTL
jgi:hypothetical protein